MAGVGVNVSQSAAELPVPHATSLAAQAAHTLGRVDLLAALASELRDALAAWQGESEAEAISLEIARMCATIGWDVVVDVPSGPPVTGTATGLSSDGALLVQTRSGQTLTVLAGDVRVRRA